MSEAEINAGGVDSEASGGSGSSDSVSYESYQKLLNQRKSDKLKADALEAKLKELEKKANEQEENKLKEQNKFKELYEAKSKEVADLSEKFTGLNQSIVRAEKLSAFERAAGAPLKHEAYYSHVDVDAIRMDDSGNIDSESLNEVVGAFRNVHGDSLFNIKTAKTLPSGAPNEAATKGLKDLTTEEIKAKLKELGQ